jgi:bifunctional non-homologous end joining protein LigD
MKDQGEISESLSLSRKALSRAAIEQSRRGHGTFSPGMNTQLEIADYYVKVARWIVPYLKRRPLGFLHGQSARRMTGDAKASEFASVEDKKGLLALVGWGTFEFHTWNCLQGNLEHPDQIIMDFDPGPGVAWYEVKNAAHHCRDVCLRFGLRAFLKVSGRRGLHVHVPFRADRDWAYVATFAKAIAAVMSGERPGAYTMSQTKKARRGVVAIGTFRNARGATIVAPYSYRAAGRSEVRARVKRAASAPGSIALPIEWGELKRVRGSNQFTLTRALKRIKLRKRDPWQQFSKVASIQALPRLEYSGANT